MTDEKPLYIEIEAKQVNHHAEKICGDVFLKKRIKEDKRIIVVISDGMGHGVKANILGTLTATMALNFTIEHRDPERIAEVIMNTLPVCSERQVSYATFTVVDLEIDGKVNILEYDNPQTFILRGNKIYEPQWTNVEYEAKADDKRGVSIRRCSFKPCIEDRIIFCSDGITQSGLGNGIAMGWGRNELIQFVRETVDASPAISTADLAERVTKRAAANDLYTPKDDLTCSVVYFRQPRKTILCTGPPFNSEKDSEFANILKSFNGKKIISGASTAEIIARELGMAITNEAKFDASLPPGSIMNGIDLVTEGVLTLNKAIHILNSISLNSRMKFGKGPADQICRLLLDTDEIYILVGTKINESIPLRSARNNRGW